jgi:hypothetical protein
MVTEYCKTCGRHPIPGTDFCKDHTNRFRDDWDKLLTEEEKAFIANGSQSIDFRVYSPEDTKKIVIELMKLWKETFGEESHDTP